MANSDTHTVTRDWAVVVANSLAITNGTFTVVNKSKNPIELIQSDTAPGASDVGDFTMHDVNEGFKFPIGATENLFAKSPRGNIDIGVATA